MKLINSGYNEENQVHRSIYQDDGGTFYLVENNVWTKIAPKLNIKPEELTELEIKYIKEQKFSENPKKEGADRFLFKLEKFKTK